MTLASWPQLLDRLRGQEICDTFLCHARRVAELPLVRRAHDFASVGTHRTWLDGRALALEPEIQTTFALAMSDHATNNLLAGELPVLAAAYRLTGESVFLQRTLAQLEEMAGWSPLQRPGWTCYHPGHRLPDDGKDGAWLATGTGVRALADTLEILPPDEVPAALHTRLEALFAAEIAQVVDDWTTRRPWFVQANNPITNQWVLPTEGLLRACLLLGVDAHREAYALAMRNMLMALDAHGSRGEFEEGYHYAAFTVGSMLAAARAAALAGDRRLLDHPFLQHFPVWILHHLQPPRLLINAFDSFTNAAPWRLPEEQLGVPWGFSLQLLLAECAVSTGNPAARWGLANLFDAQPMNLPELAARALPLAGEEDAPPLFAAYQRATRVNWRSSWADDASGLWVRGGHPDDQHDHQDRGHLTVALHGRPLLIETGTPAYHHPALASHFASGMGHNVLQLGLAAPAGTSRDEVQALAGWQHRGATAPITVYRLDDTGGDILVDGTAGYDGLRRWHRTITWDADHVTVADTVVPAQSEIVLFRWHLATQEANMIATDTGWEIRWPNAVMTFTADAPLQVTQEPRENHSLAQRAWDDPTPYPTHTCLIVRTTGAVGAVKLEMLLRLDEY